MWRHKNNIKVSGGFCLLLGWFALVNGWRLLGDVVCAAALHELGHCVVLLIQGARIRGLRIGVCGAVLDADTGKLPYGGELAAVLAGTATNLVCAALLLMWDTERWATAAGAHLVLCGFNLLPLRPLDGGRALYLLMAWWRGPGAAERTARIVGTFCGLTLSACLVWIMDGTGGSLWLLPAVCGLLCAAGREWCQTEEFL